MMRVQISLPLPTYGCGPTDEGARLRTLRSEFNSLHPYQIQFGSRGLKHDDASVLTKRSGLNSRREFQRVGSVTEQHGSVRSCKSGFDSRPAHQMYYVLTCLRRLLAFASSNRFRGSQFELSHRLLPLSTIKQSKDRWILDLRWDDWFFLWVNCNAVGIILPNLPCRADSYGSLPDC